MRNLGLTWLDLVALGWFLAWWVGCSRRAYYFALATMTWFLNGWLCMGTTTSGVFVLHWRELRSPAPESIKRPQALPIPPS
jgi:uncharacterized membrane protein